ncbi:helicase carboxy-terminal domain, partial [Brachionus plicatilis]
FESEKYKNLIEFNFDKKTAIDEFKILFKKDPQFFLTQFFKLSYYIRKFHLTFTDLESISTLLSQRIYKYLNDVTTSFDQNRLNYFSCLCLKYLVRNSMEMPVFIHLESIMNMIKDNTCHPIKTELVFILAYVIEKSNDSVLINQFSTELNNLVFDLVELDHDVKEFFFSKLELHKTKKFDREMSKKSETSKEKKIKTVKNNHQVVTKAIQTVRSNKNNNKTEENEFKLVNLIDTIKSRSRNFNSKTTLEPLVPLETADDKEGDDRSIFNNTWKEAINLYSIALNKKILKDTDKDYYVPSKLFGNHYFFDMSKVEYLIEEKRLKSQYLYNFFSKRLFAAIFLIVSRRQKLNDYAIDTLMKCVTNFKKFYLILLYRYPIRHNKSQYVEDFIDAVFDQYWHLKNIKAPQLIVDFCKKMTDLIVDEYIRGLWIFKSTAIRKKNFIWEHVEKVVNNEILQVRLDTVTALYNSAVRDKKILTKERLKIFEDFIRKKEDAYDEKFQEFVIKIIDLAYSSNVIGAKKIFDIYINMLMTDKLENNIKIILSFINDQAKDYSRCSIMFDDRVFKTLLSFLSNQSVYNLEIKQDILEIVKNYLEHELIEGLSDENLNILIDNSILSNVDSSISNSAFVSLLLIVEKPIINKNLIPKMMKIFEKNENSNFILLILSRAIIDNKNGLYSNNSDNLEQISSKLDSDEMIHLNGVEKKIKFEKRSNGNCQDYSNFISLITANIIMRSVENKVNLSAKTIDNLILCLNSTNKDDKQTKIIAAKCLYNADKYMLLDNLNLLFEHVSSDIYDVSVYVQTVYLHGCVRVANSTNKKLDLVHLENSISLYADQSLKIGTNDYANEINQYFFQILLYEARKQKFKNENLFCLFDYLLMLNQKHVTQIIEILIVYTGNHTIPEKTIVALDNILEIPDYFKGVFLILQNVISLGQMVPNKTVCVLVDSIYNSVNSLFKYNSFKLLEKVIQNQDVSDDVFDMYVLTKAGFALRKSNLNYKEKCSLIKFIQLKTENGVQLPIDTKLELEKQIHFDGVLTIFYY